MPLNKYIKKIKNIIIMKSIIILLGLILSININAQSSIKTTTISVKGNCEQCKERIENAADIKGVKKCTWNEKTQIATIIFDSSKTTQATIEKAIALSGHETTMQKADQKSYAKLPECCQYNKGACKKK